MKSLTILTTILALAVTLPACASFNMGVGIGYKKVPPKLPQAIFQPLAASGEKLVLSPAVIEMIIQILNSAGMEYLFPNDNVVELGVFFNISAEQ